MNFRLLTSPKNSSLSAAAIPNSWTESVSSVKWTLTRGHSLAVPSAGMCSVCSLLQAPGDHWPVETVSSYTRVPRPSVKPRGLFRSSFHKKSYVYSSWLPLQVTVTRRPTKQLQMDILYSAVKLLYRECTNDGTSAAPPRCLVGGHWPLHWPTATAPPQLMAALHWVTRQYGQYTI